MDPREPADPGGPADPSDVTNEPARPFDSSPVACRRSAIFCTVMRCSKELRPESSRSEPRSLDVLLSRSHADGSHPHRPDLAARVCSTPAMQRAEVPDKK